MNAIEFRNFRNFEHLNKMPFNGVTMLVGTNNAGKSTITKACRLLGKNLHKIMGDLDIISLMEGWKQYPSFDFSDICGNFKRALSSDAQEEIIEFTTQNGMFAITIKVTPSSNVDSSFAHISNVRIVDIIDECTWECDLSQCIPTATFTYSGKFLANLTRLKELKYRTDILPFEEMFTVPTAEEREDLQIYAQKKNMTVEELCEIKHNSISEKLNKYYDIEQKYEAITDSFSIEMVDSLIPFGIEPNKKVVLDGIHTDFVIGALPNLTDSSITYDDDTKICNEYIEYIKICLKKALASDMVVYIPSNVATNDSYFRIDETYTTDYASKIINNFYKHYLHSIEWVERMMRILGIGESFSIKQVNSDFIYVTITKEGGKEFPLADLGKGTIQLFLKILQLSTLRPKLSTSINGGDYENENILWDENAEKRDAFSKNFMHGLDRYKMILDKKIDENLFKKVVVIEEPEENLHPALQSKLADLFMEVSKLGVNVLVETHSEYLIRRSQVLIAEAKYKDEHELAQKCPFKVYYLPETGTGKPYEMEYHINGTFNEQFGKGFYDEASSLSFQVLTAGNL